MLHFYVMVFRHLWGYVIVIKLLSLDSSCYKYFSNNLFNEK